ncbi:MAG: prolipoprotein diacylglyceryl transferase, partial [Acidimicrobiia bacterium]|nr:prolipoprotein diacylglyceryl transferase [Acidimicrobiia bacterium]
VPVVTVATVLGAIPSPSQNAIEIGPLTIHFYGILIALGVIVAIVVSRQRYVRFGGSGQVFERVAIWAVVIGFLGARLGYVSTHTARFEGRPWAVLFIWEGGLALYGGILAGALTFIFLMRRWNGDVFAVGDAVAVGIPLAQAIGRWGNYFNQELFGTPSDLPWAIIIDPAHRPPEYAQYETFHPTFLYESLWNLLILVPVILWLEKRGKLAKGASFGVYIAMYAFIRFIMELLRTDTTFRFLEISRNGWVSVGAIMFGIAWVWWCQRRDERRTLVGAPTFFSPQPIPSVPEGVGSDIHDPEPS